MIQEDFEVMPTGTYLNNWPHSHVLEGVKLEVCGPSQGEHCESYLAVAIVADTAEPEREVLIGGIREIDALMRLLKITRCRIELAQAQREANEIEAELRKLTAQ